MSYSILYRPMFLKVKENMFIPIYEGGDNNVWNYDNKSRSRSWCNIRLKGMENVYCTETELIDILNNIREEVIQLNEVYKKSCPGYYREYSDKQYGYFDSLSISGKIPLTTSWNDYLNFFKKGFQNAITFEEAKELRLTVRLSYYDLENNNNHFDYINTEEELFNMIDEIKNNSKYGAWVCYGSVSDKIYDFINTLRSKKSYTKNGIWIIETSKGFIKSFEGLSPIFTNDKNEALTLTSNKIATKLGSFILKDDLTWCSYREKK